MQLIIWPPTNVTFYKYGSEKSVLVLEMFSGGTWLAKIGNLFIH